LADLRGDIDLAAGGFGIAPPLIGPNFETNWFTSSVYALFDFIRTAMPPNGARRARR
jgi:hypothetical protein